MAWSSGTARPCASLHQDPCNISGLEASTGRKTLKKSEVYCTLLHTVHINTSVTQYPTTGGLECQNDSLWHALALSQLVYNPLLQDAKPERSGQTSFSLLDTTRPLCHRVTQVTNGEYTWIYMNIRWYRSKPFVALICSFACIASYSGSLLKLSVILWLNSYNHIHLF